MMEDDQAALKDKYEAKLANVNKLLDAEKAKTAKLTADLRDASKYSCACGGVVCRNVRLGE